jgi:heterogeneous nuclear rnp K-like protein
MAAPTDGRDNSGGADDVAEAMDRLNMGDGEGRLGPDGEPAPKTDEEYAEAQLTLRAIVSSKEAGVIIGERWQECGGSSGRDGRQSRC